jgi:hypothetical protein
MTENITWKQLDGDRLRTKPHAFMLTPSGYQIDRKIGNRRRKTTAEVRVTFNREYVVAYFADIFKGFKGCPRPIIDSLIDEALSQSVQHVKQKE